MESYYDRPMATESLYDHAGGDEGLHRLEVLFYDKALADPLLRTLFIERVPTHVDHLTWFTAESFGGPDRFTRELGFGYLIDVHRNLKITDGAAGTVRRAVPGSRSGGRAAG